MSPSAALAALGCALFLLSSGAAVRSELDLLAAATPSHAGRWSTASSAGGASGGGGARRARPCPPRAQRRSAATARHTQPGRRGHGRVATRPGVAPGSGRHRLRGQRRRRPGTRAAAATAAHRGGTRGRAPTVGPRRGASGPRAAAWRGRGVGSVRGRRRGASSGHGVDCPRWPPAEPARGHGVGSVPGGIPLTVAGRSRQRAWRVGGGHGVRP